MSNRSTPYILPLNSIIDIPVSTVFLNTLIKLSLKATAQYREVDPVPNVAPGAKYNKPRRIYYNESTPEYKALIAYIKLFLQDRYHSTVDMTLFHQFDSAYRGQPTTSIFIDQDRFFDPQFDQACLSGQQQVLYKLGLVTQFEPLILLLGFPYNTPWTERQSLVEMGLNELYPLTNDDIDDDNKDNDSKGINQNAGEKQEEPASLCPSLLITPENQYHPTYNITYCKTILNTLLKTNSKHFNLIRLTLTLSPRLRALFTTPIFPHPLSPTIFTTGPRVPTRLYQQNSLLVILLQEIGFNIKQDFSLMDLDEGDNYQRQQIACAALLNCISYDDDLEVLEFVSELYGGNEGFVIPFNNNYFPNNPRFKHPILLLTSDSAPRCVKFLIDKGINVPLYDYNEDQNLLQVLFSKVNAFHYDPYIEERRVELLKLFYENVPGFAPLLRSLPVGRPRIPESDFLSNLLINDIPAAELLMEYGLTIHPSSGINLNMLLHARPVRMISDERPNIGLSLLIKINQDWIKTFAWDQGQSTLTQNNNNNHNNTNKTITPNYTHLIDFNRQKEYHCSQTPIVGNLVNVGRFVAPLICMEILSNNVEALSIIAHSKTSQPINLSPFLHLKPRCESDMIVPMTPNINLNDDFDLYVELENTNDRINDPHNLYNHHPFFLIRRPPPEYKPISEKNLIIPRSLTPLMVAVLHYPLSGPPKRMSHKIPWISRGDECIEALISAFMDQCKNQ